MNWDPNSLDIQAQIKKLNDKRDCKNAIVDARRSAANALIGDNRKREIVATVNERLEIIKWFALAAYGLKLE